MRISQTVLITSLIVAGFGAILPVIANEKITGEIWQQQECHLITHASANIYLKTDGRLSNERLLFRLNSDVPLKNTPQVIANNLNHETIVVEGWGQDFSFEMPYQSHHIAKLLNGKSVFMINYIPKNGKYEYKAIFATADLPEKITQLREKCGLEN